MKEKQRSKISAASKISKQKIRDALNAAETEFRWCFNVVYSLNNLNNDKNIGETIVGFQIRLFKAIELLEKEYLNINAEKKRLIHKKAHLDSIWFAKRVAKLASYAKTILEALTIGRSIGDAFAWFFYQNDRQLIEEHLKQQKQILLPPETGRLGERLTLEKMQGHNGHLLLHHGITSFLRMGDVTFINLKTFRVEAIGEIKTYPVQNGKVTISATFLTQNRNLFRVTPEVDPHEVENTRKLPDSMQSRLERQLKIMTSSISNSQKEPDEKITAALHEFHYKTLNNVTKRSHIKAFEFIKAGDGLIIGALRFPRIYTLADALLSNNLKNLDSLLATTPDWAKKIICERSQYNSLCIGSLGGDRDLFFAAENTPFLAWPLAKESLADILFGKVMIITLFNPAHICEKIREKEFSLTLNKEGRVESAVREKEQKQMRLDNLDYFFRLVQNSLMSETTVIALIDQIIDVAHKRGKQGPVEIQFRPQILQMRAKSNK